MKGLRLSLPLGAAASVLRLLPGTSMDFGPVRRIARTTAEFLATSGVGSACQLSSARHVERDLPTYADDAIKNLFAKMQNGTIPEQFVAELPNGRYWGRAYGYVIASDDTLLADLSPTFHDYGKPLAQLSSHDGFNIPFLPTPRRISGRVLSLNTFFCTNFHHLLLDTLPKIELLARSGHRLDSFDSIVIDYSGAPYQKEILCRAGIDLSRVVPSNAQIHLQADQLVVPSYSEPGARVDVFQYSPEGIQYIRKLFVDSATSRLPERRIIVSRRLARVRRWIQEDEALETLSGLGFIRVELETLSVTEQAQLFAESQCIIMPHGGGLANCAFAQAGTTVIELFNPNYLPTFMMALSNACGLVYHAIVGDPISSVGSTVAGITINKEDISVTASRMVPYVKSLL